MSTDNFNFSVTLNCRFGLEQHCSVIQGRQERAQGNELLPKSIATELKLFKKVGAHPTAGAASLVARPGALQEKQ